VTNMIIYKNLLFFIFASALTFVSNGYADDSTDIHEEISKTHSLPRLIKYLDTNNIYQIRHVISTIADLYESKKIKVLKSLWRDHKLPTDTKAQDKYRHPSVRLKLAEVLLDEDRSDPQYSAYIKQQAATAKDWRVLIKIPEALVVVDDADAVRLLSGLCRFNHLLVAKRAAESLVRISKSGSSKMLAKKEIDYLLKNNQIDFDHVVTILAGKNNDINNDKMNVMNESTPQEPMSEVDKIIDTYITENQFKRAADKLLPLAERGDPEAQEILGEIYLSGPDYIKDYEKAIYWLKLSAKQGNNGAKSSLAHAYLNGFGVPENRAIAIELLENAASESYQPAIKLLELIKKNE